jgi:ureidoglycolate lyase
MRITVRPPDPRAFAPFGAFVEPPARAGDRRGYSGWLAPVPGLAPDLYTNRVMARTLPLTIERVERHPRAAQMFLPLDVSRYLAIVMPPAADGAPDAAHALAFVVPGTLGLVYHPGVWHAGITVLDSDASFGVLMWRGAEDDDLFASIPPLEVLDADRNDGR